MTENNILILAIETSCDDTSASVIKNNLILSNIVSSQKVHKIHGGVVPELASRSHQKNIVTVVDLAIKEAKIKKSDINAVAYTKGPGLMGSLLVGNAFAKSFALAMNIPFIGINHMKGHILAHFIKNDNNIPPFPFLCLTVSGGHTQLVVVNNINSMEIIGSTLDDAAGEAFDKCAKILGLSYPGGPLIDKYAKHGNINAYSFSKPKVSDLDFSFSGLKTSFLYSINKMLDKDKDFIKNNMNDICASIQHTIVEILLNKLENAIRKTKIKTIAIAGGVSANSYLRDQLNKLSNNNNYNLFIPKIEYCTDNAAMIAIAGYYKFLDGDFSNQDETSSSRLVF